MVAALVPATLAAQVWWPQWALDAQHTGQVSVAGQPLNRVLDSVVYDPLVPAEMAANGGGLFAHYQVPLIDDSVHVFMSFKAGTYNKNRYSSQSWGENGFRWQNGRLVQVWSFTSDWNAPGSQADFWEPVFHAVLTNGYIYVPGAGGTLFKLDKGTGALVARINPFGSLEPSIIVAGVPTADSNGNIFYNVIQQFNTGAGISFYQHDVLDSWLVKVSPDDSTTKVSYSTLVAQAAANSLPAPAPQDPCLTVFADAQLPWPPSPAALPPTSPCGTMRPALNAAPAVAPDGTIYTVTRGHLVYGDRYGGIAAVNSDLTPKWWTSFRDRLNDGCNNDAGTFPGALLPANGTPGGCRLGSTPGVDPAQNAQPAARVLDDSSASVTVAPDGSVLYGSYTRYDFERGHLLKFDANGQFQASYPFGWDSTPAIYPHNGTYSIVIKDNEYGGGPQFGSYCAVDAICPPRPNGPFFITQLDPALHVEWKFQNTNTQSCTRNADGSVTCVPNASGTQWPNIGFEWCINAPVVDTNGVVYADSEDGNLYAINQGGTLRQNIFLDQALGAAYTPLAIGPDGTIYTENRGTLFAIGQ
jgi:outer membrane protein assembly factor BamB